MKWYGLIVDGVLMEAKRFDPDHLPDMRDVESWRLWGVPFLRMCNYEMVEVNVTCSPQVIQKSLSLG